MRRGWIIALAILCLLPRAEARPFIVAGGSDMAPYQFTGSDGHVTGILVHLYGECFRRLGIEFEYESYPWTRAQGRVQDGAADAMSTVATDKRLAYAVPGREVLAVERLVAFANRSNPHFDEIMQAQTLGNLKGLRILAQMGSGWSEENLPKDAIVCGSSPSDLLVMLAVNRADLLIDDTALTQQRLQTLHAHYPDLAFDAITGAQNALATLEFRMMLSKKSGYLGRLEDIDQTLGAMRQDGTIGRIYAEFGLADQTSIALTDTPPAPDAAPSPPIDAPPQSGAK
jgi:polar amino acid transport system substrate-binding protein